ncbi:agamous-like MADS-box protein AGL29 [Panicum miliaceum]|uniref:Agamous-like MADS-box protein AGL29 n=1 Tax=Panicum miliaceum TaxID=4540 RepID=A0A3L6QM18_PANMI|nr:agamous-like MADS-box protein AGL29 [Panicum miliaceum]
MEYVELEQSLEAEKKRKERLQEATEKEMSGRVMQWLNANIFELGLDELLEFQTKLEEIQAIVKEKVHEVMVEGRQTPRSLPQPPMEVDRGTRHRMEKTQQMGLQQRGKAICWKRISLDLAGVRILKVAIVAFNGGGWFVENFI